MARNYIIQKAIDKKDMSAKALESMAGKRYDLQPKYDGCHAVFIIEDGLFLHAMTSTGDVVHSCDHIGNAVASSIYPGPGVFAVCGEVWVKGWDFPKISGTFRRHGDEPELRFAPFDVVKVVGTTLQDERPYEHRVAVLKTPKLVHPYLIPFASGPADDEYAPLPTEYAAGLKAHGGYDGAIMHDLDAPYKVGRCRAAEVVKIKPLVELDLLVVGVEKAIGEKTGRPTVALQVRLKDGKVGKVATGLNHDQQANPEQFVGKIIAVEAMAWTKDGMLREPRFKGERFDKIAPDF